MDINTTRMMKVHCRCCGYVVRTTRQWLQLGAPLCPLGTKMSVARNTDGSHIPLGFAIRRPAITATLRRKTGNDHFMVSA